MKEMKKMVYGVFAKNKNYCIKSVLLTATCFFSCFIHAQEIVAFRNHWTSEKIVFRNGALSLSINNSDAWLLEKTEGKYVRIKNVATGKYLHVKNGNLEAGEIMPEWSSAHWNLVPVGEFVQIINRSTDVCLNNENGKLEATKLGAPGWWSAQWKLQEPPAVKVPGTEPIDTSMASKDNKVKMGYTDGNFVLPPDRFSAMNEKFMYRIVVSGELRKTTDGGLTWTLPDEKLRELSYAKDGALWGISWRDEVQYYSPNTHVLKTLGKGYNYVSGVDSLTAWATDMQSNIFLTTDQGLTWKQLPDKADKISAVSKTTAWVINETDLMFTDDAGQRWNKHRITVKKISAVSDKIVWAIGAYGELLLTTNGGLNWLKYPLEGGYFYACEALDANSAYVIGEDYYLVKITADKMQKFRAN